MRRILPVSVLAVDYVAGLYAKLGLASVAI
jgi:hypothetical protein